MKYSFSGETESECYPVTSVLTVLKCEEVEGRRRLFSQPPICTDRWLFNLLLLLLPPPPPSPPVVVVVADVLNSFV